MFSVQLKASSIIKATVDFLYANLLDKYKTVLCGRELNCYENSQPKAKKKHKIQLDNVDHKSGCTFSTVYAVRYSIQVAHRKLGI